MRINEIWKDIEDFPDYQVSNLGRIKSFKRKSKILLPIDNTGGYLKIGLSRNGKVYGELIHRLVLKIFKPIKTDNILENLEWVSSSENTKHAYEIGLMSRKGENHNMSKLKNGEVWLIRKILNSNLYRNKKITQEFIGKMFKISRVTISQIKNNKRWVILPIGEICNVNCNIS